MKKILIFVTAFTFAIGLTACSSANNGAEKKGTSDTTTSQADVKRPLVKFYMQLTKKINAKDADLNAYEAGPSPDLKEKASASAAAVTNEIKNIKIPEELSKQKTDLNTALKDLANSYQTKADELKKDKPSFDAANATFNKAVDELGNVFVSVKLLKPDLAKEVD